MADLEDLLDDIEIEEGPAEEAGAKR